MVTLGKDYRLGVNRASHKYFMLRAIALALRVFMLRAIALALREA
jgi:hypothetical protein